MKEKKETREKKSDWKLTILLPTHEPPPSLSRLLANGVSASSCSIIEGVDDKCALHGVDTFRVRRRMGMGVEIDAGPRCETLLARTQRLAQHPRQHLPLHSAARSRRRRFKL